MAAPPIFKHPLSLISLSLYSIQQSNIQNKIRLFLAFDLAENVSSRQKKLQPQKLIRIRYWNNIAQHGQTSTPYSGANTEKVIGMRDMLYRV